MSSKCLRIDAWAMSFHFRFIPTSTYHSTTSSAFHARQLDLLQSTSVHLIYTWNWLDYGQLHRYFLACIVMRQEVMVVQTCSHYFDIIIRHISSFRSFTPQRLASSQSQIEQFRFKIVKIRNPF